LHEEEKSKVKAPDPPCKVSRAPLPAAVATSLHDLWHAMLQRSRYPTPAERTAHGVHLDGVGYVFLACEQGLGYRGAEANNPGAGTRPALLADIAVRLAAYVGAAPNEREEQLQRVTAAMDRLAAALATADGATSRRQDAPAKSDK